MIRIEFPEPSTRSWNRWRSDCKAATEKLIASVAAGRPPQMTALYKRKSIRDGVYFAKAGPFHGKCAYCETFLTDIQRGDIDHFRPKLAVTDENDEPILLTDEAGTILLDASGVPLRHPGYFWLAYEWTNLLPACVYCNQPNTMRVEADGRLVERKIGKHSRFPVTNRHAMKPDEVSQENPLLIHPVLEDPSRHLAVNVDNGYIRPLTERGEACCRLFALNERERLPERRRLVMSHVAMKLGEILHEPDSAGRERALGELKSIMSGQGEYTLAAREKIKSCEPLLRTHMV